MKCKKCKAKLQKGEKVCPNCGQKKKMSMFLLILAILFFPISLTVMIIRAKKIKKPIKVGMIAVLWVFVLIYGTTGDENATPPTATNEQYENQEPKETPTPEPLVSLEWPTSELALVVPVLEGAYGTVILSNEEEVCIRIQTVSKEEYEEYRNECVSLGFTNLTLDSANWLQASNEAGYRLSLSYDPENAYMSIDVKTPPLKVLFEIECEANLIFNTYDLIIVFDDNELGNVEHGKTGNFNVEVEDKGIYTLEIRSAKDKSVKKKINVDINQKGTYKYTVSCHGSEVRVSEIDKIKVPLTVGEYETVDYKVAKKMFTDAGFTNVKTQEIKTLPVVEADKTDLVSVIYINNEESFEKEDTFFADAEVIIMYQTPAKIVMTKSSEDYVGMNYLDVKKELEELGFVNIEIKTKDITSAYHETGEVSNVNVLLIFNFKKGESYEYDEMITIKYYVVTEPTPAPTATPTPTSGPTYYSTNTYEEAKKGNAGIFSYKSKGGTYDVYWIIDFDEGYVYFFTDGNGESTCDKVKIVSGTLNDRIKITWYDSGEEWSWYLHFKYENSPVTLIVNDHYGFEVEFGTTDLDDALNIRNTKRIISYVANVPTPTLKPTTKPTPAVGERINLTIENSADLAMLLSVEDYSDSYIGDFTSKYLGETIEFDGYIEYMFNMAGVPNYFDIILRVGDYKADIESEGPIFFFKGVDITNMKVNGTDTISAKMNFTIEATLREWDEEGPWIVLEPVSMQYREGEGATMTPGLEETDDATSDMDYIGNMDSKIFHYPSCSSVERMNESNKVYFYNVTRSEVIAKGYKACGRCKP